jgi:phospholipase D1/2
VKRLLLLGAGICALAIAWQLLPVSPEELVRRAGELKDVPLAVVWVPLAYALLGLVMFPFVALRVGTILVFGPVLGIAYAILGAALSATVGYEIGRRLGGLETLTGERAERVRQRLAHGGILAVAAVRMVPTGPFALVNAFAGAARVPRRDFLLGTLLGTTPGLVVMAAAGALLLPH